MKNKTLILLSTYNGEKYLRDQLDSLLLQKNIDILIRDDGSTDNTISILKEYSNLHKNISYYSGDNLGYAKSFWQLLKQKDDYEYYAFCDQDDIWLEGKIERAITLIKEETKENEPVLYTSNVICINNSKEIISKKVFEGKVLNKYECLQKSILPGCTFVFNNKAQSLLKQYDGFMESHDWATYIIINYFGQVLYDKESYIYYRIHENNTLGIQTKLQKIKLKLKRFFKKSKCTRSKFAKDFYSCYYEKIPSKYIKSIKRLAFYKESFKDQMKLLFDKNFKGIVFKLYICLKKI
ncbi:MAG: glycosyltransferase [Candidatus Scatovivens sp.]